MGGRKHNKKSGFSLVELLITVIVIGILLTIAVPAYYNSFEKSRGQNAELNLISIYNAQKRHKLTQRTYFGCAGSVSAPGGVCTAEELQDRNHLGVYISDPYFNYGIVADDTTFTATATRISGTLCLNAVMTVTEQGSEVNKGCALW